MVSISVSSSWRIVRGNSIIIGGSAQENENFRAGSGRPVEHGEEKGLWVGILV